MRKLRLWFWDVSTLCTTDTVTCKSCLNAFPCCDLYFRTLWTHWIYNFNTYFKCIASYVVCLPFRRDFFLKIFWLEYRWIFVYSRLAPSFVTASLTGPKIGCWEWREVGGGGGGKEGEEILPLRAQRLYSETVFSATKWKPLMASFS